MLSLIFGLGGLLLMISSPVLVIWGLTRAATFQAAEIAANVAEKTTGAQFAKKEKMSGYKILLIGIACGAVGWVSFAYLQGVN